jgi:hypothetical protein
MVFTLCFAIEALMKVIAFGFKPYMAFFQNQVDFTIVVSSLVMLMLDTMDLEIIKVGDVCNALGRGDRAATLSVCDACMIMHMLDTMDLDHQRPGSRMRFVLYCTLTSGSPSSAAAFRVWEESQPGRAHAGHHGPGDHKGRTRCI